MLWVVGWMDVRLRNYYFVMGRNMIIFYFIFSVYCIFTTRQLIIYRTILVLVEDGTTMILHFFKYDIQNGEPMGCNEVSRFS
jgi:hypothetical protein